MTDGRGTAELDALAPVALVAADGTMSYVNITAEVLFERPDAGYGLGQNAGRWIGPDDRAKATEYFRAGRREEAGPFR